VNITRILCPVDFSDASAHVLEQASAIAAWYGANIQVLHVCQPVRQPLAVAAIARVPVPGSCQPEERQQLHEQAAALSRQAVDGGVLSSVAVETGAPVDVILDRARNWPADLIVMGTHGAGGFQRLVLGSVTEKVLRKTACPVLTVPPRTVSTSAVPFKHLVCAIDFSEPSLAAAQYAVSLALEGDARLTLVHVLEWPWEEPPSPSLEAMPPDVAFSFALYRRERAAEAVARLEALIPEQAREWCQPGIRVVHGKPYVQLLRIAAEDQADLLIVGVRGRSGADMHVFGSTANQLVRHARCPVLTVAGDHRRADGVTDRASSSASP
jgi:nucleotide-binding universal stress UspA family protein